MLKLNSTTLPPVVVIELRSLAELTSVTITAPDPSIVRLSIKSALAVNTTLLLIVTVGLIPLVFSKCPINFYDIL